MKVNKKCYIVMLAILFLAIVFGIMWKTWLQETVPLKGYTEIKGVREIGEVIEEDNLLGEKRWRDGDWTAFGDGLYRVRDGVTLAFNIDTTIESGKFRVVIYDLGEDYSKYVNDYRDKAVKVYEQEFTETGNYHIDLPMLENDMIYAVSIQELMDGGNEYKYTITDEVTGRRWQVYYDRFLGTYFGNKYDGNFCPE